MPRPRKASAAATANTRGHDGPDRLSPVTENYLLSLYKMWVDGEMPTLTQLTEALRQLPPTEGLGTSAPSVAGMLRRMQKQGLVDIGNDKRIRMTARVKKEGENIARRHRLAEWLVVSLLGMELHEAHTGQRARHADPGSGYAGQRHRRRAVHRGSSAGRGRRTAEVPGRRAIGAGAPHHAAGSNALLGGDAGGDGSGIVSPSATTWRGRLWCGRQMRIRAAGKFHPYPSPLPSKERGFAGFGEPRPNPGPWFGRGMAAVRRRALPGRRRGRGRAGA